MDLFQAIILGIIQGLTEFIPISSSGHLVLTQYFIGVDLEFLEEALFFNLVLHVGTVIAVVYCYWNDLKKIFTAHKLKEQQPNETNSLTMPRNIILLFAVSIASTCVMALLLKGLVDTAFQDPRYAAFGLFVTSVILLASLAGRGKGTLQGLDMKSALFIGIAQGLAVFPGISRSGMTIVAGMLTGLKGSEAARYSFILSAPTIILASIYEARNVFEKGLELNFTIYIVGLIFSAIFGVLAIKFVLAILRRSNIAWLSIYTMMAGLLALYLIN